jgi:hypothetical protein
MEVRKKKTKAMTERRTKRVTRKVDKQNKQKF